MEALNLALDITLVGALALPWVMLVFHLFFTDGEGSLPVLLRLIRKLNQPTAVAVVLFATAYFLGSVVSRMGQDFFNDEDLHLSERNVGLKTENHHLVLRVGPTENRIIASVYCDHPELLPAQTPDPILAAQIQEFQTYQGMCNQVLRWVSYLGQKREEEDQRLTDSANNVFRLQESALLIRADDATSRLQQLHYQVLVLRGAAFNGVVAFALCLFSLAGRIRCGKPDSLWRWAGAVFPCFSIALTSVATLHHYFGSHPPYDPPYMEFTLGLFSLSGVLLFFMRPRESDWRSKKKADSQKPVESTEAPQKPPGDLPGAQWPACKRWLLLTGIAGLLAVTAFLGWWSTEQMYTQQVVYSYDALMSTAQK
jgi:hypothetical protein